MRTPSKFISLLVLLALLTFMGCKGNSDVKQNEELQIEKETVVNGTDNDVMNEESVVIDDEDSFDTEELSEEDMKIIEKELDEDDDDEIMSDDESEEEEE